MHAPQELITTIIDRKLKKKLGGWGGGLWRVRFMGLKFTESQEKLEGRGNGGYHLNTCSQLIYS